MTIELPRVGGIPHPRERPWWVVILAAVCLPIGLWAGITFSPLHHSAVVAPTHSASPSPSGENPFPTQVPIPPVFNGPTHQSKAPRASRTSQRPSKAPGSTLPAPSSSPDPKPSVSPPGPSVVPTQPSETPTQTPPSLDTPPPDTSTPRDFPSEVGSVLPS